MLRQFFEYARYLKPVMKLFIAALAAGIWGIAMYWLAGYIYTEQGIRLLRKELGEKYGA